MKTLGLIPARAGSKGIPGKNLKVLAGRRLIERAIDSASHARLDRVIVSTDSEEIAEVARTAGAEVPFLRPPELATDSAAMIDVVTHALDRVTAAEGWTPEVLVLLQPTAPLRTARDIDDALDLLAAPDCDSVVSIVAVPEAYNPHWTLLVDDGWLRDAIPGGREITRRQDLPPAYVRDGTIYATKTEVIRRGSLYGKASRALIIPADRSINLDSMDDWERAERYLGAQ